MTRTCLLALILLAAGEVPVSAEEPDARSSGEFLAGTVVDDQGRPVAGADVWLTGTNLKLEAETQAHAQSDREGRFRIPVPVRWFTRRADMTNSRAIFAWKQGTQLAVVPLPNSSLSAEESVRLALQPARPTDLSVHDPSGKPVQDVRLRVSMLTMSDSGHLPLSEELSNRFAVTTDEKGRGTLMIVPPDRIGRVALESETFGQQHVLIAPEGGWTAPLVLGPVGRLKGRVTADDPQIVSGLDTDIVTYQFDEQGWQMATGRAEVTTDADGRFEVPAIRHGSLVTQVSVPSDVPFRARTTQSKQELLNQATDWAVSGEETEIEIPLEPAIRVTGLVRRQNTGDPLPGIAVHISSHAGWNQIARSNKDGRFAMYVLPGQVLAVPSVPYGYFAAQANVGQPSVTVEAKEVELPPIELLQAVTVRGRVVDEAGKPVPGATVRGVWVTTDQTPQETSGFEMASDDQGEFALHGVNPRSTFAVRARTDEAVTAGTTMWPVGSSEVLTLTVSEANWLRPAGRVVDSTGAPVAGATVSIHEQTVSVFAPREPIERPVESDQEIRTDEQGRFTARPKLERFGHYRAEASSPDFRTARTGWVAFSQLDGGFPPIVLRRTIEVRGRVVDTQGNAVPDAAVALDNGSERIRVDVDEQGRFRLHDVPAGLAFLFAHKPGHRFTGRLLSSGDEELTLTLAPSSQRPSAPMSTLPPVLGREQRHKLVRELIEPILQPDAGHHQGYVMRAGEVLALTDPAAALEQLESQSGPKGEMAMAMRMTIAQQLAKTEPDEALLVGESIEQPMWRSKVYLDVYDALPESERPRKLDMLGQAIVQARGSDNPSFRAFLLGQIGERLLDLGEKEKATEVLREGEQAANGLPTVAFAGYARGAFAEELAQIDLDAALKLTEGLSDEFEYNRHHGNIAHELAAIKPADAERILNMVKREGRQTIIQSRDQYLVRVCYRMAPVDLDRARAIADSAHDPCQRAYAYGMMAQALAGSDKDSAAALLREAFEILQAEVDAGKDRFNYVYSASTIGAALLPIAEQIDPHLVPEFFWRAVSMRLHAPEDETQAQLTDLSNAALAMFLARYDRQSAQALLLPLGPQARSHEFWLRATTLVDPHRAAEQVGNFNGTDDIQKQENARARVTVAKTLALDGDDLWRELIGQSSLWAADKEDL